MGIDQDGKSQGINAYNLAIFCGKAHHTNEQSFAPSQTRCCNTCIQTHGPLNHSDMIVLQEPCMGDSLPDDMVKDKDVDIQASSPFGKKDYTLHKAVSSGNGMCWCKNDYHRVEDFHTSFHRQTAFYLSIPSSSQLQCVAQRKISKRVLHKEGMKNQGNIHSDEHSSFSLVSM